MKFIAFLFLLISTATISFAQNKPIVIYLAGDSTMAQKTADKRPETGWGEMLQQYFDVDKVKIDNRAVNGRSTKSFIAENRWQQIVDALKRGDYVFIEFGHNDEKIDKPAVYAAPNTEYRNNLIKFVKDVLDKKATPILLTPVMRRKFDKDGYLQGTHGEYPDVVRNVASELKVPLIDLHRKSETVLKNYGAEKSRMLFLQLKAGESPNYPNGVEDNTHFSPLGAEEMAKIAVAEIKKLKINLRKYLKP